ncbi:10068_t:CDS:1, partial [Racocetra fulgida]
LDVYNDYEPTSEASSFFDEFANAIQIEEIEENTTIQDNEYNSNNNMLSCCLDEVENFVTIQFQNAELSDEPTKFEFEIELDLELLDIIKLGQNFKNEPLDLKNIKDNFLQLIKILILLLESGSEYYWNVYKLCLNLKKKNLQDVLLHTFIIHHAKIEFGNKIIKRLKGE